ncbi:MAG: hypothetical protein IJ857_02770, partial [Lachnospiraceae bacterium]|nr:hypothetical protein [Lachnospiraceae bacterium]
IKPAIISKKSITRNIAKFFVLLIYAERIRIKKTKQVAITKRSPTGEYFSKYVTAPPIVTPQLPCIKTTLPC